MRLLARVETPLGSRTLILQDMEKGDALAVAQALEGLGLTVGEMDEMKGPLDMRAAMRRGRLRMISGGKNE